MKIIIDAMGGDFAPEAPVRGALLAREGKSGEEIQAILDERREKLNVSFVIDTLEYLRKGGRCSTVAALGANLLKLKPCIEVHEGKMSVAKKYRGRAARHRSRDGRCRWRDCANRQRTRAPEIPLRHRTRSGSRRTYPRRS